jgi:hypothetical protein
MALKHKSNDDSNSDMPMRNHKMLSLSEKVKVLDIIRKEKELYAEVAKIYSRRYFQKETTFLHYCSLLL